MPFLEPAKVPFSLLRRSNPRITRQPVTIRALSSAGSRFADNQGIGSRSSKSNLAEESPKESSPQPPVSPSKDTRDARPGSTTGDEGKRSEGNKSNAPRNKSGPFKAEEEEREYQIEVEQHNKDFAEGYDRVPELPSEMKVDERFWKGTH